VEYKEGGGAAMEGGNLLPEDGTKAHVLQHMVKPLQRHTVLGMEEIQAEQEARNATAMEVLCSRQNGSGTVKDGSLPKRAELGGLRYQVKHVTSKQ
jgi:hypothetical protein